MATGCWTFLPQRSISTAYKTKDTQSKDQNPDSEADAQ